MIAVVTGGSGFIGRNLIRRLLADGHRVRCLVRPSGGDPPADVARYLVALDDPRALARCPAFEGADVVFHLAGATRAVRFRDFATANVGPTRQLLGALAHRGLGPRFVFVSSQAAAGPATTADRPVVETDEPRPIEPYGASKLEAERVVQAHSDRVPVTILRPSAVFGPHDRDFLMLFRMAVRGMILYPGVATHWLSLVHVDDVVDALLAVAVQDRAVGRTYFITAPDAIRWRALGEQVGLVTGRAVRHVDLPAPVVFAAATVGDWFGRLTRSTPIATRSKAALSRAPYWVCSAARAGEELGVRASRSLPDALADTYLWYRQHGWLRGPRRGSAIPA
ncbi:MAG: NAD-dependent epimerase/dehydratase family protein [Gemmatimonadaceae bacterium]